MTPAKRTNFIDDFIKSKSGLPEPTKYKMENVKSIALEGSRTKYSTGTAFGMSKGPKTTAMDMFAKMKKDVPCPTRYKPKI